MKSIWYHRCNCSLWWYSALKCSVSIHVVVNAWLLSFKSYSSGKDFKMFDAFWDGITNGFIGVHCFVPCHGSWTKLTWFLIRIRLVQKPLVIPEFNITEYAPLTNERHDRKGPTLECTIKSSYTIAMSTELLAFLMQPQRVAEYLVYPLELPTIPCQSVQQCSNLCHIT